MFTLKITVDGMKMRRSMISIVHGNYDTKKSTEFRHLSDYTADARRFRLTMRLSDAGLHQRQTKVLYPDHQPPPWLTEDAPRDRSNRLLGGDFLIREMGCIGARGGMLDSDGADIALSVHV